MVQKTKKTIYNITRQQCVDRILSYQEKETFPNLSDKQLEDFLESLETMASKGKSLDTYKIITETGTCPTCNWQDCRCEDRKETIKFESPKLIKFLDWMFADKDEQS